MTHHLLLEVGRRLLQHGIFFFAVWPALSVLFEAIELHEYPITGGAAFRALLSRTAAGARSSTALERFQHPRWRVRGLLTLFSIAPLACGPAAPRADLPRYVAHAMGGIEGQPDTNSLEAFQLNYAKGCRFFEVDLWITRDHKLVAFHGPAGADPSTLSLSHADFMKQKILGRYTPLDSEAIARLLEEKRDWKLVTDTKSDLPRSLTILCASLEKRKIPCRDRVIPQIYGSSGDRDAVEALGFREVIFTIYRTHLDDTNIARTARSNRRIVAVTMPPARATPWLVGELSASGVRCYVHTINGSEAIRKVFERRIWGVYTDWGCGAAAPGDSACNACATPNWRSATDGSGSRP